MSSPEGPSPTPPLSLAELAAQRAVQGAPKPSSPPSGESMAGPESEGSWRPIAPPSPASSAGNESASAHGSGGRQKWGKDTPQTRQLKERMASLSATRLVEAVRQLLGQADDTLFKFVEQSSGPPNQEFLAAFKALRQHRTSVERSFRESIDKAWGLVEEKKASGFGSLEGLSLVNDEELEENLAESLAVANADRQMSSEASALTRRLAIIDGLPEDEAPSNPLSATQVAQTFKSAMKEVIDLPVTAKMIVFKLFDREVLAILPEVLAEVNQAFVDAGVLPHLKPMVVRARDEGDLGRAGAGGMGDHGHGYAAGPQHGMPGGSMAGPGMGAPGMSGPGMGGHGMGGPGMGMPGGGQGMGGGSMGGDAMSSTGYTGPVVPWEMVQSLLSNHRAPPPMIVGPDGTEIPAPPVPLNDLISAIQHLNESVAKLDNIEPMAFKKTLQELLLNRDGREVEHPETLGAHEDAIDMIDLLFDFVLRDSELPSQIQTVLSRLQIPYLRIAVLEPQLFAEQTHPARKLLNTLSDAGKTWTEASDREGELRKLIDGTVETVLAQFDRGSELCAELSETFETQWSAMKDRASRAEKRAADASVGKEKLEKARLASAKVIINNLAGLTLPDKLRMAIHRAWAHYLTMLALREGEDGTGFRRATGLLVRIAEISRSVKGATPSSARKEEVVLLLQDWSAGLSMAGLSEKEIAIWKDVLADFCKERVGFPEEAGANLASPSTLRHEDIAASVTQSAPPDEKVSAEAMETVNALKNGTWVQWNEDNLRAKLAWIGGFTGKLMFVDHRGNKTVETHKQVLAREIEQGKAVVLSDAPLVEQALGKIERKLSDRNASL